MGPAGSVTLAATKLGKSVKLVTKIGEDIPDYYVSRLIEHGINLREMIVEGSKTSSVVIDLRGRERDGYLEHLCGLIGPEDVKDLPDAVLVTPFSEEIMWEALKNIHGKVLGVDPQGFIRAHLRVGGDSVLLKRWVAEDIIKRYSLFKCTESELRSFSGISDTLAALERIVELGPRVAVATRGVDGSLMVTNEKKRFMVPVYDVEKRDDMGAGDCFTTGFFCEYLDGREPVWCAALGSALASCVLETVGPRIDASLDEVRERAESVYDKIVRI
jgi:sugar/nucleoside kinase (ribokinase family)